MKQRVLMQVLSVVAAVTILVTAGPLAAQSSRTCGWESPDTSSIPASAAEILDAGARSGTSYDKEGVAKLRQWFAQCDEGAGRSAVITFRQSLERKRSDNVTRALLATALARSVEIQPVRAEGDVYRVTYKFSNSEKEAVRLFSELAGDTLWPAVALEATALAVGTRHENSLKIAEQSVRAHLDKLPDNAVLWSALADINVVKLSYAAAIDAAQRAVSLGYAPAKRTLAVAHLLLDAEPVTGSRLYLEGLLAQDATTLARYYEDLKPVTTPEEEAAWRALPLGERGAWIEEAWQWRASQASLGIPERLALHHKRIVYAVQQYTRVRGARYDGAVSLDSLALRLPFDDRGLVYIRHGKPDAVVNSTNRDNIRLAWIYFNVGTEPTVIEFVKGAGLTDYAASGPPPCNPLLYMYPGQNQVLAEGSYSRRETPTTGWQQQFEREVRDYSSAVAAYAPYYGIAGERCYTTMMALINPPPNKANQRTDLLSEVRYENMVGAGARRAAENIVNAALHTENAQPHFARPLKPVTSLYMFRGSDATDVVAFMAVDGSEITPSNAPGGSSYNLRMSLALESFADRVVQRMDTTLAFRTAAPLQPGQIVRTGLVLKAKPVTGAQVRISVQNPNNAEQGQIMLTSRDVVAFNSSFDMSDIIVGEETGGVWKRGSVAISPIPGHQVRAGSTFRFFSELYGAKADDPLRIRITIAPDSPDNLLERLGQLVQRNQAISTELTESASPEADGVTRMVRELGADLTPGEYVLELRITNGRTNVTASRTTRLRIIDAR